MHSEQVFVVFVCVFIMQILEVIEICYVGHLTSYRYNLQVFMVDLSYLNMIPILNKRSCPYIGRLETLFGRISLREHS